mmetsp:Transcript_22142/g.56883  ORF Transcript_22142/g.56883 Transcript_22142/m.56883 type:complete len:241 (+) Transcript_22142:608-1330(+)
MERSLAWRAKSFVSFIMCSCTRSFTYATTLPHRSIRSGITSIASVRHCDCTSSLVMAISLVLKSSKLARKRSACLRLSCAVESSYVVAFSTRCTSQSAISAAHARCSAGLRGARAWARAAWLAGRAARRASISASAVITVDALAADEARVPSALLAVSSPSRKSATPYTICRTVSMPSSARMTERSVPPNEGRSTSLHSRRAGMRQLTPMPTSASTKSYLTWSALSGCSVSMSFQTAATH